MVVNKWYFLQREISLSNSHLFLYACSQNLVAVRRHAGHDCVCVHVQMLMRIFLEPGDAMLCEEYTYPHVPESLVLPAGFKSVRCEMDERGVIPERLLATLEAMEARGERTPRLLYTIPTGQNPTGEPHLSLCSFGCMCMLMIARCVSFFDADCDTHCHLVFLSQPGMYSSRQ